MTRPSCVTVASIRNGLESGRIDQPASLLNRNRAGAQQLEQHKSIDEVILAHFSRVIQHLQWATACQHHCEAIRTENMAKLTGSTNKAASGPPQELVSCIDYLTTLLKNLPCTLPLDPVGSKYDFSLDPEKVEDWGTFGAFGNCMEICFKTYKAKDGIIHFKERGKLLEQHQNQQAQWHTQQWPEH